MGSKQPNYSIRHPDALRIATLLLPCIWKTVHMLIDKSILVEHRAIPIMRTCSACPYSLVQLRCLGYPLRQQRCFGPSG